MSDELYFGTSAVDGEASHQNSVYTVTGTVPNRELTLVDPTNALC
jgi:hypothetical protein